MLTLQTISYIIGGREILDNLSFQVATKQHVCLVGRNGAGKSTIFKLIEKEALPDAGTVEVAKNWKILAVKQEMPDGSMTPLEFLLAQDKERSELFTQLENCEDMNIISDIYERLEQIDAYSAEAKASKILKGLGFDDTQQNQLLQNFSGGYRMRVALAATLFLSPDLLLLDEPTNHLDFEATKWLQIFLKEYSKSFILISHDRDFINNTSDYILHLKNKKIGKYKGNFDTFLGTYQMQQENAASYNKKLDSQKTKMMTFVNRFKAKASKAKQAQSRLKAVEKMQFIPVDANDPTVAFNFPKPEELSPPIITYNKIDLGYEGNKILKHLTASIAPEDRIALVGANGNGKSTFAKFLAGELKPLSGNVVTHNKLKIGFYKQDQLEDLDPNQPAYELISDHLDKPTDFTIRSHLGKFGFGQEQINLPIHKLSGGERARLLFATLTTKAPNLLILDEPTNHLDIEMRESLISSINAYEGAVILITHDRHLLKCVADDIWLVKDQTITRFDGDISDYEKMLG